MDGYLVPGINKEHYTCSKNLSNYSSLVDVRLVAGTYFEETLSNGESRNMF